MVSSLLLSSPHECLLLCYNSGGCACTALAAWPWWHQLADDKSNGIQQIVPGAVQQMVLIKPRPGRQRTLASSSSSSSCPPHLSLPPLPFTIPQGSMVRHNNVIPNQHFHKDWQNRVRTWFDQVRDPPSLPPSLRFLSACMHGHI